MNPERKILTRKNQKKKAQEKAQLKNALQDIRKSEKKTHESSRETITPNRKKINEAKLINGIQEAVAEGADLHQEKGDQIHVADAIRNHQENALVTESTKEPREGLQIRVLMTRESIPGKETREAVKDIRDQGIEKRAGAIHEDEDRVRIDVEGWTLGAVRGVTVEEEGARSHAVTKETIENGTISSDLIAGEGMALAQENVEFRTEIMIQIQGEGGKMVVGTVLVALGTSIRGMMRLQLVGIKIMEE